MVLESTHCDVVAFNTINACLYYYDYYYYDDDDDYYYYYYCYYYYRCCTLLLSCIICIQYIICICKWSIITHDMRGTHVEQDLEGLLTRLSGKCDDPERNVSKCG